MGDLFGRLLAGRRVDAAHDEGAASGYDLKQAFAGELTVDLGDRVAVSADFDRELARAGELHADGVAAAGNAMHEQLTQLARTGAGWRHRPGAMLRETKRQTKSS